MIALLILISTVTPSLYRTVLYQLEMIQDRQLRENIEPVSYSNALSLFNRRHLVKMESLGDYRGDVDYGTAVV